jgi:Ca-activated chloride channel family protein
MIRYLHISFFSLCFFSLAAQNDTLKPKKDGWANTRKGNVNFNKQNYTQAEKYYRDGVKTDTSKTTANYNLGNALYKQKKYDEAEKAYADAISGKNADSLSRTWHNLGNSMLQQNKYQESINAYKQALKLKPDDEQTRYNLAYAQSKLKKQQPPPQQQKGNPKDNKQPQKPDDKNQGDSKKPDQKKDN